MQEDSVLRKTRAKKNLKIVSGKRLITIGFILQLIGLCFLWLTSVAPLVGWMYDLTFLEHIDEYFRTFHPFSGAALTISLLGLIGFFTFTTTGVIAALVGFLRIAACLGYSTAKRIVYTIALLVPFMSPIAILVVNVLAVKAIRDGEYQSGVPATCSAKPLTLTGLGFLACIFLTHALLLGWHLSGPDCEGSHTFCRGIPLPHSHFECLGVQVQKWDSHAFCLPDSLIN